MVDELMKAHAVLLKQMQKVMTLSEEAKDEGTIDLLGAYVRELEKNSWMLSAWSKKRTLTPERNVG